MGTLTLLCFQITPERFEYESKTFKIKKSIDEGNQQIGLNQSRQQAKEGKSLSVQSNIISSQVSFDMQREEKGLQCDFVEAINLNMSTSEKSLQNRKDFESHQSLQTNSQEEKIKTASQKESQISLDHRSAMVFRPQMFMQEEEKVDSQMLLLQKKVPSAVIKSLPNFPLRAERSQKSKYQKSLTSKQQNLVLQEEQSLRNIDYSKYIDHENVANAELHMAFLYASPFIYSYKKQGQPVESKQLDFQTELNLIKDSIIKTKKQVKMKSCVATIHLLQQILIANPLALHFSGHGILEPEDLNQKPPKKERSRFLLFEKENGDGDLISGQDLLGLIQRTKANIEFVFVASCGSEFAGEIFKSAGVKHVICVKGGALIQDLSIIKFARLFYNYLFSSAFSICDSFQFAKQVIQSEYGEDESQKIMLLLGGSNVEAHQCKLFGPLHNGKAIFETHKLRLVDIPAPVKNLIGRSKDQHGLMGAVQQNRLVTIVGIPGVGKTAVAKNICHFFSSRSMFNAGILLISAKGLTNSEIFAKQILSKLEPDQCDNKRRVCLRHECLTTVKLLELCLKSITETNEKFLLVMDNSEDLIKNDKDEFCEYINMFLSICPKLHILITSHVKIGAQIEKEYVCTVRELQSTDAFELFNSLWQYDKKQVSAFINNKNEGEYTPSQLSKYTMGTAHLHPLFLKFCGNPQAIILSSTLMQDLTLVQLYQKLSSEEMTEVLTADGIQNKQIKGLRVSLEAILQVLEEEDKENLEFFYFLGMLPGGISEKELDQVYYPGWERFEKKLEDYSLVSRRVEKDKNILSLPPFIQSLAEAKITDELKVPFQNDICHYYQKVCKAILDENNLLPEKLKPNAMRQAISSQLLTHAQNILSCLSRLIDESEKENQKLQKATRSATKQLHEDVQDNFRRFNSNYHLEKHKARSSIDNKQFIEEKGEEDEEIKEEEKVNHASDHSMNQYLQVSNKKEMKRKKSIIGKSYKDEENLGDELSQDLQSIKRMETKKELADTVMNPSSQGLLSKIERQISHKFEQSLFAQNSFAQNFKEGRLHEDSFESSLSGEDSGGKPEEDIPLKTETIYNEQEKIMNASTINFKRLSQVNSVALENLIKADQNQTVGDSSPNQMKRGLTDSHSRGLVYSKQRDQFYQRSKQRRFGYIHDAEQLILHYVLNLYLLGCQDEALRFIRDIASKVKGSKLYEANLNRIEGLIQIQKQDYKKCQELLNKAKQIYVEISSIYGQALISYSIGHMYLKHKEALCKNLSIEKIYRVAEKLLSNSLSQFTEVNHLVGMALCLKKLSKIARFTNLPGDKIIFKEEESEFLFRMFQKSKSYKMFTLRTQKKSISMMIEIVYEAENKHLFPIDPEQEARTKFSRFKQSVGEMVIMQHQLSLIEEKEAKEVEDELDGISIRIAPEMIQKVQIKFMNGDQVEENSTEIDLSLMKENRKKVWSQLEKRKQIILSKKCIMVSVSIKEKISNSLGFSAQYQKKQQKELNSSASASQLPLGGNESQHNQFEAAFGNLISQKASPIRTAQRERIPTRNREGMGSLINVSSLE